MAEHPEEGRRGLRSRGSLLTAALLAVACATATNNTYTLSPAALDDELFALVLATVNTPRTILKVDPRPLPADTSIISLHDLTDIDDRIAPPPVFSNDSTALALTQRRRAILERLALPEVDATEMLDCPGGLLPPTPEVAALRQKKCPASSYYTLVAALPRPVQRNRYAVRALLSYLSPKGANWSAHDYVFEKTSTGWRLVDNHMLFIVE